MNNIFGSQPNTDETEWISFSDLMAVLMVIFLFISIIYFDRVDKETKQIIFEKVRLKSEKDYLEKSAEDLQIKTKDLRKELADLEQQRQDFIALRKSVDSLTKLKTDLLNEKNNLLKDVKKANTSKEAVSNLLINFQNNEDNLYDALLEEFSTDLDTWQAELIREDLMIRFKAQDVLFAKGDDQLSQQFMVILDSFIPRYVKVLKVFGAYVEEVRVEGHTSSEFGDNNTDLEKYIGNMRLSQDRTRAVTSYALSTLQDDNREWLQRILTANGLSSSKLIRFPSGNEDEVKSRRVEFKVRTSSRATISELQAVIE